MCFFLLQRLPLSLDRKVLHRSPKKEKQDRSCIDSFNPLFTLRFCGARGRSLSAQSVLRSSAMTLRRCN